MIIPVRCFTCNETLGNVWEYYQKKVKELEKQQKEASKGQPAAYKNFEKLMVKDILDELELDNMCCRRHLLAHVDLIEMI